MVWRGDPRTSTTAWRRLRRHILERDRGICHVCGKPGADEVDHIRTYAECQRLGLDPDAATNLAAIHDDPCHRRKSSSEGHAARLRLGRPKPKHPGLR